MDEPDEVMHEVYLPVSEDRFREHFAPVAGTAGDPDRHLMYYRASLARLREFESSKHSRAELRRSSARGRQVEKDERFWVASALLGAFYPEDKRVEQVGRLLRRALGDVPRFPGRATWEAWLTGPLKLYFEVNAPSPPAYKEWLRGHLDERVLVPYVREGADRAGAAVEGATKVDAVLASESGFCVVFEAKVLSDASTMVSFDVLRNQLARSVDVMLDRHQKLAAPLAGRDPSTTCFVLLSPEIFQRNPHSRLYGRLMNEYMNDPQTLERDLPHRSGIDWSDVSRRIGWLTFQDCEDLVPGSCRWLSQKETAP